MASQTKSTTDHEEIRKWVSARGGWPARIKRIRRLCSFLDACLTGFWLGVLDRGHLHALDQVYYDGEEMYCNEEYNCRGFWSWEQEVIRRYFGDCKRLLVGGAGGGREVLALCREGYEVEGFECNPRLIQYARTLLEREGLSAAMTFTPRDKCFYSDRPFDGAIVGWGAYMLIQQRRKRVAFLKQLRAQVRAEAPLLLSFYARQTGERRFVTILAVGNALRWLLRRERLDLGDDLAPNYVHYFTKEQITSELQEAGFELARYSTRGYGHAVAIAARPIDA
jgi:hypothetical protein